MTSEHLLYFFDPLLPLSAFGTDLSYRIHATSLTATAFPWPPSPPPSADVIYGWSIIHSLLCTWSFLDLLVRNKHFDFDI